MKPPPVRYTRNPDGAIAYEVMGEGPVDLVTLPNMYPNLEAIWEEPTMSRFFRRLASFSRLILINPLGTGLSDAEQPGVPTTPEETIRGVREVMDEVGSEQAALLAIEAGGVPAMFFASTLPHRTSSLCLVNCYATLRRERDYPWGFPADALDRFLDHIVAVYGTAEILRGSAPEQYADERFREWYAKLERLSNAPRQVRTNIRGWSANWDGRGILASIQAQTLVIAHAQHAWVRPAHGQYLAEHIRNARYAERPGYFGLYWIHDVDWVVDEVQAFLTGRRGALATDDRVLATVLFTDIVASTQRAAELGDRRWRELLDEHDSVVRREIDRFRGRTVNFTGDGFLATFDGPARAIRCAVSLSEALRSLGIDVRTGLHTGEIEQRGDNVGGIAVHIGARVMAEAGPGEVLVSGAVPPLVAGSGLEFDDRGLHELKGVPGEWRLYEVNQ